MSFVRRLILLITSWLISVAYSSYEFPSPHIRSKINTKNVKKNIVRYLFLKKIVAIMFTEIYKRGGRMDNTFVRSEWEFKGVWIPGRGKCSLRTTSVDARVKYPLCFTFTSPYFTSSWANINFYKLLRINLQLFILKHARWVEVDELK